MELPDVTPGSDEGHFVIFGQVVGIYIDEQFIDDGIVRTRDMQPLARMGYMEYAAVTPETTIVINRPEMAADGSIANLEPETWDGVYR